jgi:aminodeoxychorismate lyase
MHAMINKKFIKETQALVSIGDRAFRFGDGIFETLKIMSGKIHIYRAHQDRLLKGLSALKIHTDISSLERDCYKLIKKNSIENGILRISISRGSQSVGYYSKKACEPLVIIEAMKEKITLPKKIRLGISKIKAQKKIKQLQHCKTMQSLNYILAKNSAIENGNFDDVMLDSRGFVSEASSANIFWIKNAKIYTPSLDCDLLPGVVRKKLLEKFDVKITQTRAKIARLKEADEIFLTNSILLALPVDELVIDGEKIKYKKTLTKEVIKWIEGNLLSL